MRRIFTPGRLLLAGLALVAVFLALALGHSLGRLRLRGFALGPILEQLGL